MRRSYLNGRSQLDIMFEKMEANSKNSQSLHKPGEAGLDREGSSLHEDSTSSTNAINTNTNVYIGNLPHSITEDSLFSLCAYYGYVKHVAIKYGNPTNIYGFVCMRSHHEAELLIDSLQNYMMDVSLKGARSQIGELFTSHLGAIWGDARGGSGLQ